AEGVSPTRVALRFRVAADTIRNAGDDELWRLSRLRWLDSRLDEDNGLVPPYTPVEVSGNEIGVLGRRITLGPTGFPTSIRSYFDIEMTRLNSSARELLSAPVTLTALGRDGTRLTWYPGKLQVGPQGEGAAEWEVGSVSGPLEMTVHGREEFDGHIQFTVSIKATEATDLSDIRLEIPIDRDVARYAMGLGLKGGVRPDTLAWTWDVKKNHDAAWIGDVNAGLQFSLRDDRYRRPLNTNFYQSQPLIMPASWDNGEKGGCRFGPGDERTYLVRCYSGARHMAAGEVQRYDFILLLTPFKTLDTRGQWDTRYFHAYVPLDSVAKMGANTINVHHATAINPWINYPFLRPDTMRAYIDAAHRRGFKVKIYYTVRELTDHAPEIFALQSLGHEVFSTGPGGGFSWLQEHLNGDYIAAWHVPEIKDAAIVNTGISRWHNFYVEGLNWLVQNVGIDGLYIDDVAFDRTTMQRVRKVLDRGRPGALIDLHSANQYNPRDGFVNSANLYLEHFPYINRLWFGEYFDYNSPPDYWLIEVSGIPFGLMGEMLQDDGNPWRGQVFGMTNRLPWSGDPRALWKAWDDFGIQQSRMIGFWVPDSPVKTGRDDILATSYIRDGKTMVALASWAPDTAQVSITIDWNQLGLDPARARFRAPAIAGFQEAREFAPGAPIPVLPGKGWLLVVE
ncbi:MAG: glycoside hydrolase domain-containing protein, partial [Gemmatimonadota bacterium]